MATWNCSDWTAALQLLAIVCIVANVLMMIVNWRNLRKLKRANEMAASTLRRSS
jgi:uncharacterized membrane protein YcjF (UPF0283 family)